MRYVIFNANWLGDVLFSTPAIRAIKKHDGFSYVACVIPERCLAVLKNNPLIDELIVFPDKVSFFGFWRYWVLALRLRRRKFDAAIFFQRSSTKTFIAFLAGIPKRIGYGQKGKIRTLTLGTPNAEATTHRTDHFLGLLEPLGIPPAGREPDFTPSVESEKDWATLKTKYALSPKKYIVMHVGGNWDLKRWPKEHFSALINQFLKNTDFKIVLCGTEKEISLTENIISAVPRERVSSLAGKTSLDVLALLLRDAALLISNDSGPIHLGASQSVPIIGLYGPTDPLLTGPIPRGISKILRKDAGCESPCYFKQCNYRVCMDWIGTNEVFAEAQALLKV